MTEEFQAVVIGSGFGGSVTAERLAREGWKVLVLERGRPYPPGSFPRAPRQVADGFWDPEDGRYGMFDVWSFTGLNAVTASGLGGGSLIYANVLLEKPPETFVHEDGEPWPVGHAELADHYERVREVLMPVPFPVEHEPVTPKTVAMQAAAAQMGVGWDRSPLAVAFAADGGPVRIGDPLPLDPDNVHWPLRRQTCRLCGECDVGCNYGSKHTLDHTYLSRAQAHGAQLRTLCEATVIRPRGDGYDVTYRQHLAGRERVSESLLGPSDEPTVTVHAKRVIVAAGTIGTARLLLRNRLTLPRLSGRLGHGFSSNGDLLTFAVRTGQPLDMATGPVITGSMPWSAEASPTGRMFQIQDAGVPAIGAWLFHAVGLPGIASWALRKVMVKWLVRRLRGDRDTNVNRELAALIGGAGVEADTLPLLGMGCDIPGGRLYLDGDDLECDWDQADSQAVFDAITEKSREIARRLGGELREVPLANIITVHALGGCAMAHGPHAGVVDAWGEAFGHEGLHIADGSVLPGPVGPNPSLTIAALADRFAGRLSTLAP